MLACPNAVLCYISILHQTTTAPFFIAEHGSCVIFLFYIKPQLKLSLKFVNVVVLYFYSTSNHNCDAKSLQNIWLCYISILHQTTTFRVFRRSWVELCYISILHQTTTLRRRTVVATMLCYISILHQTTTLRRRTVVATMLCYISILHQTTTDFIPTFDRK